MRKVTYLKNAYKTLASYDEKTKQRIINAVDIIPRGDIKKIQGEKYPPLYRLRVGKHRIIYHIDVNNNEIIIAKIDTRGDIYK